MIFCFLSKAVEKTEGVENMGENIKNANQRLKLFYLNKILFENTDEDHGLTMPQIIGKLEEYGIFAARKALYEDLEALRVAGADIIFESGKNAGYKMVSREFELPELKLLADAVSSSRFLTEKKSRELIQKLEGLTSVHQRKQIERQLYISNRVKSFNELIYYNVDTINQAIAEHKKISFKYFDYDIKKNKKFREGVRICSPYALTWESEMYYLIAYYEKYDSISNFRVDRMDRAVILEEKGELPPKGFNLTEYLNSTFSMFSGKSESVKLKFHSSLANAVIDRFGKDVTFYPYPDDEEHFNITVQIKTETPEPFFGWLFQFGNKVHIISPEDLKEKYRKMLNEVLSDI